MTFTHLLPWKFGSSNNSKCWLKCSFVKFTVQLPTVPFTNAEEVKLVSTSWKWLRVLQACRNLANIEAFV